MVDGIMTTGSEVIAKAGSAYSVAFDPHLGSAFKQAEGLIDVLTRFNFTKVIGDDTVSSGGKALISDTASAIIANQAIVFDLNNYPNLILAEDMINVNRDTYLRNLSLLRDSKTQSFITGS